MSLSTSTFRFVTYYQRHGFRATVGRAVLALKRRLFSNGMVIFCCDLARQTPDAVTLPGAMKVQRLCAYSELGERDLHEMTSFWNPTQAHRNIRERFEKGASLWLIHSGDNLAGYSWTLRGRTIAEYYFPMGQDDVQLFDFYVFPKFRGRAVLWFLVVLILHCLKNEGVSRVFGDVAEWNRASLSFYKTLPFQRLGRARTWTILGATFVSWSPEDTFQEAQKVRNEKAPVLAAGKESPTPSLRV